LSKVDHSLMFFCGTLSDNPLTLWTLSVSKGVQWNPDLGLSHRWWLYKTFKSV